jgi:HWE histidine kinase
VNRYCPLRPTILYCCLRPIWVDRGLAFLAPTVSGLIGWWAFLSPHVGFFPLPIAAELELLTYAVACALIIWGADSYRRLAVRLREEERVRTLAVEELAHRLKNKIASIQSIISYQLREQPRLRDDIIARLVALAATDDLIMTAQGRGASLRAILSVELKPYGLARISMEGPDIILTPTVALTMALIVHELATNAAKYGALSLASGKAAQKIVPPRLRIPVSYQFDGHLRTVY